MDESYEVSYAMTPELMMKVADPGEFRKDVANQGWVDRLTDQYREQARVGFLIMSVGLPFAVVGVVSAWRVMVSGTFEIIDLVSAVLAGILFAGLMLFMLGRRKAMANVVGKQAVAIGRINCVPGLMGDVVVTLNERGAAYRDTTVEAFCPWPAFSSVRRGETVDALLTFGHRIYLVPHAAHESPESRDKFLRFIDVKRDQHGGARAVWSGYLSKNDLACTKCKYPLRGTDGTCPECGTMARPDDPIPAG